MPPTAQSGRPRALQGQAAGKRPAKAKAKAKGPPRKAKRKAKASSAKGPSSGTAVSSASGGASLLRAALPKLWRSHNEGSDPSQTQRRKRSRGEAAGKSQKEVAAVLTPQQLRAWLQSPGNVGKALREWSQAVSDGSLRGSLRSVAGCPPLRQRMGFRFRDPSKSGSWGAENLVGHGESRLGRLPLKRGGEVSWHSYWTAYRLRLQGSDLVIQRTAGTKELSTRIEKRRRGEIGGPLASELVHVTAHSRRELAADRRKKIKVIRRAAHLLPAVIMRPSSLPQSLQRWTLIYLHGMGSSALANYADRPHYFHDGTASVKVIIPTAPSREVSCFDTWFTKTRASKEPSGSKWRLERFNSWYDYTSNHGGRREDTLDLHSLHAMQRALHKIIWREAEELGGRTDRILLGGKSQGCATALDAALTFPKRLGGFVGLVGHLLSCTPVDPGGPQVSTPFHFHHEVEDDIMQWDWVQLEEQRLRDAGYQVRSTRSRDPEGTGHFIGGVEGQWIRRSLREICGGTQSRG